jgi:hypothetical protein
MDMEVQIPIVGVGGKLFKFSSFSTHYITITIQHSTCEGLALTNLESNHNHIYICTFVTQSQCIIHLTLTQSFPYPVEYYCFHLRLSKEDQKYRKVIIRK